MKKLLFLFIFILPVFVHAQDVQYPWVLTGFGGAATLCTEEAGCFGPSGLSLGGSFGRNMTDTWAFELEGAYAKTNELLDPRFDEVSGTLFTPELERTRIWGGGNFLAKVGDLGASSNFFISIGLFAGYEQQVEITPPGIFHAPTRDIGLKGGAAGGAGLNYWFNDNWGIRPEVRMYLIVGDLSGLRYTAGLMRKF